MNDKLHPDVVAAWGRLTSSTSKLRSLAERLIATSKSELKEPDTIHLWQTLWTHRIGNRLDEVCDTEKMYWVYWCLEEIHELTTPPAYLGLSAADRKKLIKKIENASKALNEAMTQYGVDSTICYSPSGPWKGFTMLEQFGESNQARARADAKELENLVPFSTCLEHASSYAIGLLKNAPRRGKQGANAEAIRFARALVQLHKKRYSKPLNFVVATLTNRLYGTSYQESDVVNLDQR